jgi:hypothetical protein
MVKRLKILFAALILLSGFGCGPKAAPDAAGPAGIQQPRLLEQGITPLATPTDLQPTPTETLPPPPELPTPESLTPTLATWSASPTYSAESKPGYFFSLTYDASIWALTEGDAGISGLINRQIPYCQIVPTGGRGLPRGWTVDDRFRAIGVINYEIVTASQNDVVQFINYFGGDGTILTGFQVTFQDRKDECVSMTEVVLASLTSVVAPTPTPTPLFTPTVLATSTP